MFGVQQTGRKTQYKFDLVPLIGKSAKARGPAIKNVPEQTTETRGRSIKNNNEERVSEERGS